MENLMYLIVFPTVVAVTFVVELLFNKSLRRRAVEIDENAEAFSNRDVAITFESPHVLMDKNVVFKMNDENNNAFDKAA